MGDNGGGSKKHQAWEKVRVPQHSSGGKEKKTRKKEEKWSSFTKVACGAHPACKLASCDLLRLELILGLGRKGAHFSKSFACGATH